MKNAYSPPPSLALRAGGYFASGVTLRNQIGMIPQITVLLLDSAHGHPLQSWTFEDRDSLTMGRSPENDIVVTDPYVSRAHAYLKFDSAEWRLIAISRQLIFHEGRTLPDLAVADGTVCRLGPYGCYLRFTQAETAQTDKTTISFDATLMPIFNLDREKMQREVSQIADAPYFQRLKTAMRERREQRREQQRGDQLRQEKQRRLEETRQ